MIRSCSTLISTSDSLQSNFQTEHFVFSYLYRERPVCFAMFYKYGVKRIVVTANTPSISLSSCNALQVCTCHSHNLDKLPA